jgi:hypothetical protein
MSLSQNIKGGKMKIDADKLIEWLACEATCWQALINENMMNEDYIKGRKDQTKYIIKHIEEMANDRREKID